MVAMMTPNDSPNPIGRLQEWCQQVKKPLPEYELDQEVHDHQRIFTVAGRVPYTPLLQEWEEER
jgi:dsRNA-specific ribonuclease